MSDTEAEGLRAEIARLRELHPGPFRQKPPTATAGLERVLRALERRLDAEAVTAPDHLVRSADIHLTREETP